MDEKRFNEIQESIIEELSMVISELIAGRTEEAYNKLVDLRDELTVDVINSKDGEEKVDRLIEAAGIKHIENEYKKELSESDQTIR